MDPRLLLSLLVPVLVLIGAGVVLGILLARRARRDAAQTRRLLDEALARPEAPAPAPAPTPTPAPAPAPAPDAGPGEAVSAEEMAAVRDDVGALRALLEEQIARQAQRLASQDRVLESLAAEVRALAEASAAPPEPEPEEEPPPPVSPRESLRLHALAEGWEDVAILEDPADPDSFIVEARRGGLLFKGRAYVRPGGRVEADLIPAVRAFP